MTFLKWWAKRKQMVSTSYSNTISVLGKTLLAPSQMEVTGPCEGRRGNNKAISEQTSAPLPPPSVPSLLWVGLGVETLEWPCIQVSLLVFALFMTSHRPSYPCKGPKIAPESSPVLRDLLLSQISIVAQASTAWQPLTLGSDVLLWLRMPLLLLAPGAGSQASRLGTEHIWFIIELMPQGF